jgi:multiple sugar transport system permease protein
MHGALSCRLILSAMAMPLSGSLRCSRVIPSLFFCRPSFGVASTALCVTIGSMAAYALARVQYKPKFGNIVIFVILTVFVIVTTSYVGIPWYVTSAVALALFFFLARVFGKRFKATLGNGDILFWMISQRILPPIVVIIPVYMMFQAVGLLDTHLGLIIIYAVANLPIVVWLMHDFFAGLPIELEESAQLDGATRFGIFWDIVLPLTRPGLAATTLLTLILNWNEYLFAVFLSTSKAPTLPIMVAAKNAGERGTLWWEMCAIIVVMIIPVIIMAIILQRFIAKGVLLGAVKG